MIQDTKIIPKMIIKHLQPYTYATLINHFIQGLVRFMIDLSENNLILWTHIAHKTMVRI